MNMRLLVTFIFLGMFMFAIDSYALNNNGPHDPALKKITISDPVKSWFFNSTIRMVVK